MSDPMVTRLPAVETEALHRLTARLATLDLDPATLEILTAILTADIDLSGSDEGDEVIASAI
ncbi:MAG TPA: hypothetical protein VJS45_02000 [Acidimicrobiia bacterium]|nr:hypothetical protein [Acidimicrobiia bacterium]